MKVIFLILLIPLRSFKCSLTNKANRDVFIPAKGFVLYDCPGSGSDNNTRPYQISTQ